MNEKDFLRAILEDPANDGPRRAYSDWLRENGQDARGEFIAVQLALASETQYSWRDECKVCGAMPDPEEDGEIRHSKGCYTQSEDGGGSSWAEPNPRWEALKRRERELLTRYESSWTPRPITKSTGHYWLAWNGTEKPWQWSRGFVSAITLPTAAFITHAPAIFAAAPIERVTLSDKRPEHQANWYGWYRISEHREEVVDEIPECIHDFLSDIYPGDNFWRASASEADALDNLSAACVAYGRSQRSKYPTADFTPLFAPAAAR